MNKKKKGEREGDLFLSPSKRVDYFQSPGQPAHCYRVHHIRPVYHFVPSFIFPFPPLISLDSILLRFFAQQQIKRSEDYKRRKNEAPLNCFERKKERNKLRSLWLLISCQLGAIKKKKKKKVKKCCILQPARRRAQVPHRRTTP